MVCWTREDRVAVVSGVLNFTHDQVQVRDGCSVVARKSRVGGSTPGAEQFEVRELLDILGTTCPPAIRVNPGLTWNELSDNSEDCGLSGHIVCRQWGAVGGAVGI